MSYAIFYDEVDRGAIARQLARPDLPPALATQAAKHWDGGFKNYQTAPGAPYARLEGDETTSALEVSAQGGLADLVVLLRGIAAAFPADPLANYMAAIADDLESGTLGNNSAAKEPWTGS
jgi:hypothetical protein